LFFRLEEGTVASDKNEEDGTVSQNTTVISGEAFYLG
jgi:hypothetical protein